MLTVVVTLMAVSACRGYHQAYNEMDQARMQQTADAFFAGQEDATKACKGEMNYE